MRILLVSLVLLLCSIATSWAADGWVTIASTNEGGRWEAQVGSLEFSKTRGGDAITVIIGRITFAGTNTVSLYKWYVPLKDCVSGSGVVITLNMSGEYQFENDFVFNGGNVASAMASIICEAAKQAAENAAQKSM